MRKKTKISSMEATPLVIVALCADALNWIPGLNFIITGISIAFFQVYFWLRGARGKGWSLAGNLLEFIPFFSALPAVTLGVVTTIFVHNAKVKIKETTKGAVKGKK